MYNVEMRCVCANIVAVENQCVKYSECVFVALVIQHLQCAFAVLHCPL